MKLHFLGTTGYHPNDSRHTACLMIPEDGIILDAGTGIFRARQLIETNELHILLTHAHLDHSVGLTFIIDVIHGKNVQKVFLHGEAEKLETIQQHLFTPSLFPVKPPFNYVPLSDGELRIGESVIHHFPLNHPGGSIGFLIERDGKRYAYVTDTTAAADAAYVEQIAEVDLLVHECYFPDGYESLAELTGHSCASQVATVAKQAQVKELKLVHVNPLDESEDPIGLEKVREIFPTTSIATDGEAIDLRVAE